ncbi:hypothetical protein SEA_AEGEUS_40 [Mycobacterium phage Aegeus]|nr:hypothetical protein SEA_BAUDELAIRE_40 [Mycobacterium phage Baudelaire]WKW86532.1 hypothetical protein SEA_AEGEUS_40 [Mycobacterium phage Aegeus]
MSVPPNPEHINRTIAARALTGRHKVADGLAHRLGRAISKRHTHANRHMRCQVRKQTTPSPGYKRNHLRNVREQNNETTGQVVGDGAKTETSTAFRVST